MKLTIFQQKTLKLFLKENERKRRRGK